MTARTTITVCLLTASMTGIPGVLRAQAASGGQSERPRLQVSAGTGWGALWDDETMLGRGAPVSGSLGWLIGGRLLVSGDVEWFHHTRDAGYLATAGDAWTVLARGTWLFGDPASRVRATAGAGAGVLRSTGTLTVHSVGLGPGGLPQPGPDTQTPWRNTTRAIELNGGVRVALTDHIAVRPEMRWRTAGGGRREGGLEPPFMMIGGAVHVDVGLN